MEKKKKNSKGLVFLRSVSFSCVMKCAIFDLIKASIMTNADMAIKCEINKCMIE